MPKNKDTISHTELSNQLSQWVESLKLQSNVSRKDRLSPVRFENLKQLCSNRRVTIRLAKIVKAKGQAAEISKRFLRAVCLQSIPRANNVAICPSIQQRKLSQLSRAASKLAARIQINTIVGVIPPGTDRLQFTEERLRGATVVFPPIDSLVGTEYDGEQEGYLPPTTLSSLISSFASILDDQVRLIDELPTHRYTSLNMYADSLAELSSDHLDRVDSVLIEHIILAVTGEKFTGNAVSKRHRDKPTS